MVGADMAGVGLTAMDRAIGATAVGVIATAAGDISITAGATMDMVTGAAVIIADIAA